MSIEQNGEKISKMYIGTPPTDATKILMSKDQSTTVAEAINVNNYKVSQLEQALSKEIEAVVGTEWVKDDENNCYKQTVIINGMKNCNCIMDLVTSINHLVAYNQLFDYSKIYKFITDINTVTFYAKQSTNMELSVQFKAVI